MLWVIGFFLGLEKRRFKEIDVCIRYERSFGLPHRFHRFLVTTLVNTKLKGKVRSKNRLLHIKEFLRRNSKMVTVLPSLL